MALIRWVPRSPVSGQKMCLRLALYQTNACTLSDSLNKLQAISPPLSQQQTSEPNLESENVDMLSDGGSYFCVSLLPHQLERIASLQGTAGME